MKQGLFEHFKAGEIESFAEALFSKTFPAGAKVIVQGDASDFVYWIQNGEAAISIDKNGLNIPVRTLSNGDFFGESAVITHYQRNATVTAKTPLKTLTIFREDFRRVLNANPAIASRFEKMMQFRNRETKQFAALATILGAVKNVLMKKIHIRLKNGTVKDLSKLAEKSGRILIFTGAGISRACGFSEIHGKGGVWDRFLPVSYDEFLRDPAKQRDYWRRKKEFMKVMARAKPSISHLAIGQYEKSGKLVGVVTQNIDGLHQMAGLAQEKVIELNGTNRVIVCVVCRKPEPWESVNQQLESGVEVPQCSACGGLMKPNTISVGQTLEQDILFKSLSWAKNCDLLIVLGSSLVGEYDGTIVQTAIQNGAKLAVVNLSETLYDADANLILRMPAEEVLPFVFAG